MASLLTRASLLLLLTVACGDAKREGATEEPPAEDGLAGSLAHNGITVDGITVDATVAKPIPQRAEAAAALSAFGKALLASPTGSMEEHLRIPAGLSEQQLAFFYKELRQKHVNEAGISSVLDGEFGLIAERLGEKAQSVCDQLGLTLEETWVFGDVEGAAILQWDGQRFWVAGVYKLRGR